MAVKSAVRAIPTVDEIFDPDGPLVAILPGYEYRKDQAVACRAVLESFNSRRHCLMEAGTGVGKTLAYLIPAAIAASEGRRTVISTHTISLQTQLIEKDIPRVAELFAKLMPWMELKAVLMKGRGNYICLQDVDAAEGDLLKITDPLFRRVQAWSRKTKTGDVADLPFNSPEWSDVAANVDSCRGKDCRYYDRCHYYRMRWSGTNANIIVVNHALFFSDLALKASDPESGILPDYHHVVFDEAHHLEDVATKTFSVEASNRRIPHYLDRLKRTKDLQIDDVKLTAVELLNTDLFAMFESERPEFFFDDVLTPGGSHRAKELVAGIRVGLEGIVKIVREHARIAQAPMSERLEGLERMGIRLMEEMEALFFRDAPGYIRWGERTSQRREEASTRARRKEPRVTLHYTPVSVHDLMNQMMWVPLGEDGKSGRVEEAKSQLPPATPRPSAVLCSATLSNSGGFSYLRSRLGIPDDAIECISGSPFDFKRQAMLYVPGHLPSPPSSGSVDGAAFIDAAIEEIKQLLILTAGRTFILFTSRKMLGEVYDRLHGTTPFPLFRQGDQPPGLLLRGFRESGNGCLLGTQTFWEGVDVRGEALSCVIIDRLPFAVPDSPITRARTDIIKDNGGDWFNDFSVPQAQIRLKQGFGRLIRTREDRGIVCILDTRLITKSYGREFVRHLPPASRASTWSRVERFWKNDDGADDRLSEAVTRGNPN